jgi:hypothetical protein
VQPLFIYCGTGLTTAKVAPRERVTMSARVLSPNRLRRIRVGIRSAADDYVVWSPVIDLASGKWGPAMSERSSR